MVYSNSISCLMNIIDVVNQSSSSTREIYWMSYWQDCFDLKVTVLLCKRSKADGSYGASAIPKLLIKTKDYHYRETWVFTREICYVGT